MLRKLTGAALVAAVAGGVYFTALPADASNMGFKLERSFKLERAATGRAFLNLYYVSFPLFNGLDPNLANTGDTSNNKCVGDPGPPAGPAAGDNFMNADDAICDMWTVRDGLFQFYHLKPSDCTLEVRAAEKTGFGIRFSGGWTSYNAGVPDPNQALDTDRASNPTALDDYRGVGYQVTVGDAFNPTATHDNRAVIVGSHDPNFGQLEIRFTCTPALDFLNVPYHTMYQRADHILCGLDSTQDPVNGWQDVINNNTNAPGADGMPDTCPNGIFNSDATARPYQIQVTTFDNVRDATGPAPDARDTDNTFVVRLGQINNFGKMLFQQDNFSLTPGDSYQVTKTAGQNDATPTYWRSPHF